MIRPRSLTRGLRATLAREGFEPYTPAAPYEQYLRRSAGAAAWVFLQPAGNRAFSFTFGVTPESWLLMEDVADRPLGPADCVWSAGQGQVPFAPAAWSVAGTDSLEKVSSLAARTFELHVWPVLETRAHLDWMYQYMVELGLAEVDDIPLMRHLRQEYAVRNALRSEGQARLTPG